MTWTAPDARAVSSAGPEARDPNWNRGPFPFHSAEARARERIRTDFRIEDTIARTLALYRSLVPETRAR